MTGETHDEYGSGVPGIEDAFREMFAERSADVPVTGAPYGRLRQRIEHARHRRRQRVGVSALALVVAAAGVGAWAVQGSRSSTIQPAGSHKNAATHWTYDDGAVFATGGDLTGSPAYAGYMRDAAQRYLAKQGFELPDASGYTVVTTFNHVLMDDAVSAADKQLWHAAQPAGGLGDDLHLAFAVVDPADGHVRAFYTGVDGVEDYLKNPFNAALDGGVQIGQLMFPITAAAAFERGFGPQSTEPASNTRVLYWPIGSDLDQSRLSYATPQGNTVLWPPPSADQNGSPTGMVSVTKALGTSDNAAMADLGMEPEVTPMGVYQMGRGLGFKESTPNFTSNPSLLLGVTTVPPLVMASAYSAFPAGGTYRAPVMVTEVRDGAGKVVWRPKGGASRAMSAKTAGDVAGALHDAALTGNPSINAAVCDLAKAQPDLGAQTSTTDFDHAAWLGGFTSKLSVSVTLFRQTPDGTLKSLVSAPTGTRLTGGGYPGSVFADFMSAAGR